MNRWIPRSVGTLVLGLFLFAALAPVVASDGDPPSATHDGKERGDAAKEKGEGQRNNASEHREKAREDLESARKNHTKLNLDLTLEGVAHDKEGRNYTLEISGTILAKAKFHDGNLTGAKAKKDTVHIRVLNASGAVVREGDVKVKFDVHKDGDGWKWHLKAAKKWFWEKPKINLHGNGTFDQTNLTMSLHGEGKILVKLDGQKHAHALKASVEGALARK